ncbi:SDR family NAD(P)-dependent oxidoreductase [Microbacteriaceae bacterium VKM Ac-2854]|nr:SDR family NAD(P)-dependent oxidoreductase [Microbacteriaceae bacterium VKM Ac-2854]
MPAASAPVVVVTGATAGLGYFTAEQLAAEGARVVLAARSAERSARAADGIRAQVPGADVRTVRLDLADLDSVRRGAAELSELGPIDALVNNAGVLGSARRAETVDGHELMYGTNHLGHFALTALVLPALAADGRVVHLGSIARRFVRRNESDRESRRYRSFRSYCRSKLAVMLTGFELAQRMREAGRTQLSIVAHPGYAVDELSERRAALPDAATGTALSRALHSLFAQGKDAGAEPTVAAAIGADARSGDFLGPSGWQQLRGTPVPVFARPHAHDRRAAARLWRDSEEATGVRFDL